MFVIAYLLACLLVALNGRFRRFGFVGALFLSLALTPVISFLLLWVTAPIWVIAPKGDGAPDRAQS